MPLVNKYVLFGPGVTEVIKPKIAMPIRLERISVFTLEVKHLTKGICLKNQILPSLTVSVALKFRTIVGGL